MENTRLFQFGPTQVCNMVGISKRQLDYWVLIGIISPHIEARGLRNLKKFSFHHIEILKEVKRLTDEGFMVHRALDRLKRDRPELFSSSVLAEEGEAESPE